jgi:hypothetical protein
MTGLACGPVAGLLQVYTSAYASKVLRRIRDCSIVFHFTLKKKKKKKKRERQRKHLREEKKIRYE